MESTMKEAFMRMCTITYDPFQYIISFYTCFYTPYSPNKENQIKEIFEDFCINYADEKNPDIYRLETNPEHYKGTEIKLDCYKHFPKGMSDNIEMVIGSQENIQSIHTFYQTKAFEMGDYEMHVNLYSSLILKMTGVDLFDEKDFVMKDDEIAGEFNKHCNKNSSLINESLEQIIKK